MKSSFKVFIVIILSMLLAVAASADSEKWKILMEMKDGFNWYYDHQSIIKQGDVVEARVKNAKTDKNKGFLCRLTIDCSQRKWSASEFHYYDYKSDSYKLDKGVTEIAEKEGWKNIAPDSFHEVLYGIICK